MTKNELTQVIDAMNNNNQETDTLIVEFMSYLNSSKFHGVENNYINAREVFTKLQEIRNKLV